MQDFKVSIESVDVEAQAGIRMLAELLKKVNRILTRKHTDS